MEIKEKLFEDLLPKQNLLLQFGGEWLDLNSNPPINYAC